MKKIVIASRNPGKIKEFKEILKPLNIKLISAFDIGLEDVEETGKSLEENAILKAKTIANKSGLPTVADDSGLFVDFLDGFPGLNTSRYSNGDSSKGMDILLEKLKGIQYNKRTSYFKCVIAFSFPDGDNYTFDGKINGFISEKKEGIGGFGHDAIFIPGAYEKTFAQIEEKEKNLISHRALALEKFTKFLKNNIC